MNEPVTLTVRDIARACDGRLVDDQGHGSIAIHRIATIADATPDAVTWVVDEHYARQAIKSRAGAIIGRPEMMGNDPRGILVKDPELAIALVLEQFAIPPEPPPVGIHPTAVVADDVQLGNGVAIGPLAAIGRGAAIGAGTLVYDGVSIGASVRVGEGCVLHPRTVIYDRCELGDRVIVHSGTVIGADGFGYFYRDGRHVKVPQIGTVVIENDVEIGANSCIDRAKVGATRIGRGTKIDNLVQIAHNCEVGPLSIIVAQVGLSGSVRVGKGVMMGGQVGVAPGATIGDGARLAARAVVWTEVPAGQNAAGEPARENALRLRELVHVKRLGSLYDQVADLARRVKDLEASADHRKAGRD